MRSLSNLVKSFYVKENEEDSRIIDSNEIVAEKLRVLAEKMEEQLSEDGEGFEEGFVEGLDADQVEELMADREGTQDGGIQSQIDEARAELSRLQEQADQVVADAKSQADSIMNEAQENARTIEADARNVGHEEDIRPDIRMAWTRRQKQKGHSPKKKNSLNRLTKKN